MNEDKKIIKTPQTGAERMETCRKRKKEQMEKDHKTHSELVDAFAELKEQNRLAQQTIQELHKLYSSQEGFNKVYNALFSAEVPPSLSFKNEKNGKQIDFAHAPKLLKPKAKLTHRQEEATVAVFSSFF